MKIEVRRVGGDWAKTPRTGALIDSLCPYESSRVTSALEAHALELERELNLAKTDLIAQAGEHDDRVEALHCELAEARFVNAAGDESDLMQDGHLHYYHDTDGRYIVRREGGCWNGLYPFATQPCYVKRSEHPMFVKGESPTRGASRE